MNSLRPSSKNSSAGFTLIEVLAVVVIIGILAAIAAPSWFKYVTNQRIGAVKNDLAQVLRQTQQEAIKERTTVKLVVNTASEIPSVTVGGGPETFLGGNDNLRPNMVKLASTSIPKGDTPNICFNYQGIASLDLEDDGECNDEGVPFVISITAPDTTVIQQCVVVANLVGSVRTARGDACDNPVVEPE